MDAKQPLGSFELVKCQLTRSVSVADVLPPPAENGWSSTNSIDSPDCTSTDSPKVRESYSEASRRTKERQIRFVVERVSLWRKLYNGVELNTGETIRYSLEDAARLVGISKKSLDDYLLQLRFGRMYHFDFRRHQNENIGVLRRFVREQKTNPKSQRR